MNQLQDRVDELLEDHDVGEVLEAMAVTLEAQMQDAASAGDAGAADDYEVDLNAVRAGLAAIPALQA